MSHFIILINIFFFLNRDYLTGFHKRKLARKLKAKEKLDNLLKEERRKIKQKVN